VVTGIPDPALVVLVGASASGKSTWAQARYRAQEVVSSDELRGIVGSGRHDLDASEDAFRLLDDIVAARARRGLTCVIDTLGLDPARRRAYLDVAGRAGLPAIAVLFDVPPALARQRNAQRDRPVPSPTLTVQLKRASAVRDELDSEGWDSVVHVAADTTTTSAPAATSSEPSRSGLRFVLQLSRFPWDDDPSSWLKAMAHAADGAGFDGIALMDHLIQIPQVDRAWSPIPEPWVTLGMLAGLDTRLHLGTLVSPVTFRSPGITAKTVATLDAISGGRAFLGIGAGWWEREHDAYGLAFPAARQRLDDLERGIETIRALWSPGTKAYEGVAVELPETTCYPRPASEVPIIVGGGGDRTLRIAARLGDGCNVLVNDAMDARIAAYRTYCEDAGREPSVTVLDTPVTGADRDEVWSRIERLRGNTKAATYARTHHAGTHAEQRARYATLIDAGVRTIFVAPAHLATPDDVLALAPMLT